ncbi:MAG: hypothetical protein U5K30_01375 [Acidimicrobiales bacterium]|nr:hypothetical protein [Acidimicrobiales bacterium]
MTATRDAYRRLLDTLEELGDRFAGEEWGIADDTDVAEAHRLLLHLVASGLETQFEDDPSMPVFRPIVTPWRKTLGDNADAIYHDARVHPGGMYRVRGRTGGAVYVSFTVESGPGDGSFPEATDGVLNDTGFSVESDGSFEFTVGGLDTDLPLGPRSSRITVRHYWEQADPPAVPPAPDLALSIDLVGGDVPRGPRAPTDASVAADIDRLATFLRGRTIDTIAPPGTNEPPAFVSTTPNEFPAPVAPGTHALAAADAAYSMAPYLLGPDEALVVQARWPACRCANLSLWNRQMQTFDYRRHPVSLNRAQTTDIADDGTFTVVIAHEDPGMPNWLDTEGRPFGLAFWRYLLPEGQIATPQARVVPVVDL